MTRLASGAARSDSPIDREGAGDDTLNGGLGNDTMAGGIGNNIYYMDSEADTVTEEADEGTDTVYSSVNTSLAANVENLTLVGNWGCYAHGNELDNIITGNSGNNLIYAYAGADTVYGGGGNDVIRGYEGDDVLFGGAGDDIMAGADGSFTTMPFGNDTLVGGAGNDTYGVTNVEDIIIENAGEGTDRVVSTVSYTLGPNIEHLTLSGPGNNLVGTGNALDNIITGTDNNDVLNGLDGNDTLIGGGGTDNLTGGAGDDTYIVEGMNNIAHEQAGEGYDTVISASSYTIFDNIERLELTGSGNTSGTGNNAGNVILGNVGDNALNGEAGNDTLIGGGGADTLNGGNGSDTFVFNASAADPQWDTAVDTVVEVNESDQLLFLVDDPAAAAFIGTAAFSAGGETEVRKSNGSTSVEVDVDGDGATDYMIATPDIDLSGHVSFADVNTFTV